MIRFVVGFRFFWTDPWAKDRGLAVVVGGME